MKNDLDLVSHDLDLITHYLGLVTDDRGVKYILTSAVGVYHDNQTPPAEVTDYILQHL